MEWISVPMMITAAAAVVVTGLLIAWGVSRLEADRARDAEGTKLQERIAEPMTREPQLASASVLPVVTVPRRGPMTIELTGQVPSQSARDLVLEITHREMARVRDTAPRRRAFRVVDSLEVVRRKTA